jgi:hypothetical protein
MRFYFDSTLFFLLDDICFTLWTWPESVKWILPEKSLFDNRGSRKNKFTFLARALRLMQLIGTVSLESCYVLLKKTRSGPGVADF